jgi:hypothetical protein
MKIKDLEKVVELNTQINMKRNAIKNILETIEEVRKNKSLTIFTEGDGKRKGIQIGASGYEVVINALIVLYETNREGVLNDERELNRLGVTLDA